MITHKQLYLHNRQVIQSDLSGFLGAFREFEERWIRSCLQDLRIDERPLSFGQLTDQLDQLIEEEASAESEEVRFVEERITLEQFRILVQEFALDGLTEAQSFYYIMPRLPLPAQLPMLRILIDEFGSANPSRMHTTLYINLLKELQMPTDIPYYLEKISDAGFAFVNHFYWLTIRADDPSYFAGSITYLESIIPHLFPCYTTACKRLGIKAHHYYSEHCHIDHFHAIEGRRLLQAMARQGCLDADKAWLGARLTQAITNHTFNEALRKAVTAAAATGEFGHANSTVQ